MRGYVAFLLVTASACSKTHAGAHAAADSSAPVEVGPASAPAYTRLAGFGLIVSAFAEDGANLYAADDRSKTGASRTIIASFPKTGGPPVTLYDGTEPVRAIVADHGVVFVLSRAIEGGVFTLAGGKLTPLKMEGASGVDVALTNVLTDASLGHLTAGFDRMVVDATSIYLAGNLHGDVAVVPRAGGKLKTLAQTPHVTGLACDATSVYFTTAGGDVERVPKAGGAPTTLASGRYKPSELAVDGDRLAWIEGDLVEAQHLFELRAGGVPTAVDLGPGWRDPSHPALVGGDLFYLALDKYGLSQLFSLPAAAKTPVELRSGAAPSDFLVDDARVYFVGIENVGDVLGDVVGSLPRKGG